MLDGQTVILEDYLEVRPEMKGLLENAISTGRIQIGPWYVLPDENLVSGEAIIRNLERGMAISRQFGRPMMLGYLPDQFGHIASMPEILNGFGIDTACLWRGVGEDVDGPVFIWEGSGGSEVTCIYLPLGYGNAANLPIEPEELRREIANAIEALENWYRTCPVHGLPYLLMNGSDHQEVQRGLPGALKKALEGTKTWQIGTLPEYAAMVQNLSRKNDGLSRQSLPTHKGELRSSLRAPLLVGVTSTRHWIKQRDWQLSRDLEKYAEPLSALASLTGAGAPNSQAYLDLAWKYLLQNEPHDSICGCSIDQVHADMSYRFDQCEMLVKSQVKEAGKSLASQVDLSFAGDRPIVILYNPGPETDQALADVSLKGLPPGTRYMEDEYGNLYPLQIEAAGPLTALEEDFSMAQIRFYLRFLGGRKLMDFYINRASISPLGPATILLELETGDHPEGNLDIEALKRELVAKMESMPPGTRVKVRIGTARDLRVLFHPGVLPSLGIKTFVPSQDKQQGNLAWNGLRGSGEIGLNTTRGRGRLFISKRRLENEFFRVEPARDGYFIVTDLETGVVYPVVNLFVDGGDRGDEYNWDPPKTDRLVSRPARRFPSPVRPVRILVEERGPVRDTLRLEMTYLVPGSLAGDRDSRDRSTVPLEIVTRVSLSQGIKRIDFRTTVENRARDHRLRVHFRVPFVAEKSFAGCQFTVVERAACPSASPASAVETALGTHPMRDFVDVSNGTRGLAVSTRGLFEYELIPGPAWSDLAITLMRCVGYLSRPDLRLRPGNAGPQIETPGAQCIGRWDFEYSVYPHPGSWAESGVYAFAQSYQAPPVAFQPEGCKGKAQVPATVSFFRADDPNLIWSALRRTAGGWFEMRFYNVSDHPGRAKLTSLFPLRDAASVNLAGDPLPPGTALPSVKTLGDYALELEYGPRQIVTLKFRGGG